VSWAPLVLSGKRVAPTAVAVEERDTARGDFAGCLAGGGGSGAARTTVRGVFPAASGGVCRVVSGPSVTTVGSVTAAAMAVPATAAVAMIAIPLLTSSPVFADSLIMVSAVSLGNLNCKS